MSRREVEFRRLVASREASWLRSAYALCWSRSDAQDLVQESLARAYARVSDVSDLARVEAYVRRCMTSVYLDGQRRRRRFEVRKPLLLGRVDSTAGVDAVDDRDQLRRALARLPVRQRVCVVLRFYEDLSVEQTADQLGWATGTVKRETHDGLAALRRDAGQMMVRGDDDESR